MTRRSPLNKRYQNEQRSNEPTGSTRKSAASAKIKRSTPSSKSAKPKTRREKLMASARSSQAKSSSSQGRRAPVPDTPELKHWRRIWWIMIGAALVTLVPSLILNSMKLSQKPPWSYISLVLMLIAVVLVIAVWVLDFRKIRPLTRQAQREAQSGKKK
ncbi:MAG: hypothetical protein FWC54_04200 [Actinomycetia bacterium]|nr:hypothetical protein [Actinomycetes bacterium]